MVGQHALSGSPPYGKGRPLGFPMENFRGWAAAEILQDNRARSCRTGSREASMDECTQGTLQALEAFAFVEVKDDFL